MQKSQCLRCLHTSFSYSNPLSLKNFVTVAFRLYKYSNKPVYSEALEEGKTVHSHESATVSAVSPWGLHVVLYFIRFLSTIQMNVFHKLVVQLLGLGRPLTKRLPRAKYWVHIVLSQHHKAKSCGDTVSNKKHVSEVSARRLPPSLSFCFHLPLLCRTSSCRSPYNHGTRSKSPSSLQLVIV